LFTSAGWIFHQPLNGNDYGIDARVEIVDDSGEVSGLEFFAQVKATKAPIGSDHQSRIKLGQCGVGTIEYWYAKSAPTVLILYTARDKSLYWNWLPEIVSPGRLVTAVRAEQATVALTMERRPLNKDSLVDIHQVVGQAAVNRGAESLRAVMQKDVLFLYRTTANCLDILTEWLAKGVLHDSADSSEAPVDEDESSVENQIQKLDPVTRLTLPVALLYQSLQLCLSITGNSIVDSTHPALRNTQKVVALIDALFMDCYASCTNDLRALARHVLDGTIGREKMVFIPVSTERATRNWTLLTLVLRDYLSVLRTGVFPQLFGKDSETPVADLAAIHEISLVPALAHLPEGEERTRLVALFDEAG